MYFIYYIVGLYIVQQYYNISAIIYISLSLISFCCWPLSPANHQPALAMSAYAKLINLQIYGLTLVIDLSVQHRHHFLMTKKILAARQRKIASKIIFLVPVLWIPTTEPSSLAETFRLKLSETCSFVSMNQRSINWSCILWLTPQTQFPYLRTYWATPA